MIIAPGPSPGLKSENHMKNLPEKYQDADRWAFADNEALADALAKKVVEGVKTATCAPLDDEGVPQVGDTFVVVDGRNQPVCAIELTSTDLVPFDQVPESHARAEAEGDGTLADWRQQQQAFFEEYEMFSPQMTLVLMNFRVVETF